MQARPSRPSGTFQRSFSSQRATVVNGNDRTPSFVGVCRYGSLRETSSRAPAASTSSTRQTSSASSSPRHRDVTSDRVGCLATTQVPVTRTSSLSSCKTLASNATRTAGGSVGRSATLPAARGSLLPTATRTVVQQRLKVTTLSHSKLCHKSLLPSFLDCECLSSFTDCELDHTSCSHCPITVSLQ